MKKTPAPRPKKSVVAKKRVVRSEPVVESVPALHEQSVVDQQVRARYEQVLVSWLERHKKYPRAAKRRRQQGAIVVQIGIDRSGAVKYYRISQKSEHELLNREVARMVDRANPFPAMPVNYPGNSLEFYVPVHFKLSR